MTTVVSITREQARKRWLAGLPIAMAATPGYFDQPRDASVFTRGDVPWADFDVMVRESARADIPRQFAAPVVWTSAEAQYDDQGRFVSWVYTIRDAAGTWLDQYGDRGYTERAAALILAGATPQAARAEIEATA